jgi:hypothetical protein
MRLIANAFNRGIIVLHTKNRRVPLRLLEGVEQIYRCWLRIVYIILIIWTSMYIGKGGFHKLSTYPHLPSPIFPKAEKIIPGFDLRCRDFCSRWGSLIPSGCPSWPEFKEDVSEATGLDAALDPLKFSFADWLDDWVCPCCVDGYPRLWWWWFTKACSGVIPGVTKLGSSVGKLYRCVEGLTRWDVFPDEGPDFARGVSCAFSRRSYW